MSSRWLSFFATTFLILTTAAQAKEAKGGRNETKRRHDDDEIDEVLAACLNQSAYWLKEQKSSPLYQYHGLADTLSATVEALLSNGPTGGDNWAATMESVANTMLPFMGLPFFGDGGALVGAIGGSVLSFLGAFTTDKADQLRAELASALPKIISQAVANAELAAGYSKAHEIFEFFANNFVEIFEGTTTGQDKLAILDGHFTTNADTIFGDACVTCTSGCQWSPTDTCTDVCRSGPVTYQYGYVLLHLITILEEAAQADNETRTEAFLKEKLDDVVRSARYYGDLLQNSMSTWADHGLDHFQCKYDPFKQTSPDAYQPPFVTFVADLSKDSRTTPFGIDFVASSGCQDHFSMIEYQSDGYRPDPTDKPCEYDHGYCSDHTYDSYRGRFADEVRKSWSDLIDFVKKIGNMTSSTSKAYTTHMEDEYAGSALPSTAQSLRR